MTEIFVCGSNQNGQLLLSKTKEPIFSNKLIPLSSELSKFLKGTSVKFISCGSTQTLIVLKNGVVLIFGILFQQQAMNKKQSTKDNKPNLIVFTKFKKKKIEQISTGSFSTLLLVEGKVWELNYLHGISGKVEIKQVKFENKCTGIFSGANYQLFLDHKHHLLSAGICSHGELAHKKLVDKVDTPTEVISFLFAIPQIIGCGAQHFIVYTYAGELFACGKGENGQLGTGDFADQPKLKRLYNKKNTLAKFGAIRDIACGDEHSIILNYEGSVFVCGKGLAVGRKGRPEQNIFNKIRFPNECSIQKISASGGYGKSFSLFLSQSNDLFVLGNLFESKQKKIENVKTKEKQKKNENVNKNEKENEIEKGKEKENEKEQENEKEKEIEKEKEKEKEIEIEKESDSENDSENEEKKEKVTKPELKTLKIPQEFYIEQMNAGWQHIVINCSRVDQWTEKEEVKGKLKTKNKKKKQIVPVLGYFSYLSPELIFEIFGYLDTHNLAKLALASSEMNYYSSHDFLWSDLFHMHFGPPNEQLELQIDNSSRINSRWKIGFIYWDKLKNPKKITKKQISTKVIKNNRTLYQKLRIKIFGDNSIKALMVGLDGVGKTTLLYRWKLGETVTTIPTIGFNVETVEYGSKNVIIWEVCGGDKIRPLWRHYLPGTQVLIWVVDSNDRARILESKYELNRLLSGEEHLLMPVVVVCNKQDLPNAMTPAQIVDHLDLLSWRKRNWFVQPTIAITGEGIYKVLDWIQNNYNSFI
ncbi:adp-ribosylation factor 2-like [Anaeramoeba flamelloides]|uniref:Adp-ribosylation factor 2-like n=1 Tax=Anaeramoeba flamelloides TaxID=1746091 RepID=A0AAV7Z1C4_9EUKA|nr:adp-ribosylation factor 2-like [Anaeramoeba flamelloides]